MSGFQFNETMSGTFTRNGDERPFRFTVQAKVESLTQFVGDYKADIEGHVEAGGLANHAPITGHMVINPVLGGIIAYQFSFTGDDGKKYAFAGQKDVTARSPVRSMTTLPVSVTDAAGAQVASANLMFDLRDLPDFLSSFKAL